MKYVLIGCGRISTNHIKAAINNNLEIVAVCDVISENMESVLEKNGLQKDETIKRYNDYKLMIKENPDIQLASIATESGLHAEIAIYCIEHDINVIIEKPMAMSLDDADRIIDLSEERNIKVCACHQNRFNVAVQQLRKAIEAGRFGKLSHGSIHVRWNRNEGYYTQAPWRGTWAQDGGCLMNQCIHGIDLLRWMFGDEVEEVYGQTRQQLHDYLETEDAGMAVVKFKNGAVATIEGTTNVYPQNLEETLYVFGERGTVKIGGTSTNNIDVWDFVDEDEEDQKNKGLQESTSNVYGNGHTSLFADVIDAINNDRTPYVDAHAGRNALEMILAIYKSQKTGMPVKLPLTDFKSTDMIGEFRKKVEVTDSTTIKFDGIYTGLLSGNEKLALVGLGYVGMPIAVEFAKHVNVIGFDINEKRIKEYKNGIDATNEIGPAIKNTTVEFTADPTKLGDAKFIIVAVPTPVKEDNSPDLGPVEGASKIVGQNIRPGAIVVFESTVYPGVTEDICVPIIEKESGLKCGVDWKIGYSPERINPGDRVHTLTSIVKVVSGMDEEATREIKKVYDIVIKAGTFPVSTIKTAEAVKVIENSQRDINIAFVNEVAMICDRMGIDTDEVIAGMNTKWNALRFKPGLVGGHCIGVDPYYLTNAAEKLGYHSQIILNGRKVNDSMGAFVADAAIKQMIEAGMAPKKAKVVILGITFKENCPDTRNSKVVDIIDRLKEFDIEPVVTDAWADVSVAKHEYGVELIPYEDIPKADCVIVAVGHKEYRSMSMMQIKELFRSELSDQEKVLIDVKSLYRKDELDASGMRYWRL